MVSLLSWETGQNLTGVKIVLFWCVNHKIQLHPSSVIILHYALTNSILNFKWTICLSFSIFYLLQVSIEMAFTLTQRWLTSFEVNAILMLVSVSFCLADWPPLHEEDPSWCWGIQRPGGGVRVPRAPRGGFCPPGTCCTAQWPGWGSHHHQVINQNPGKPPSPPLSLCILIQVWLGEMVFFQMRHGESAWLWPKMAVLSSVFAQVSFHPAGPSGKRSAVPWNWAVHCHPDDWWGEVWVQKYPD